MFFDLILFTIFPEYNKKLFKKLYFIMIEPEKEKEKEKEEDL